MADEFELIAEIRDRARRAGAASGDRLAIGSGDDAAVTVPGGATATSTDTIVDGIHFRLEWAGPREVGRKALAAALSDLAAMGAEPGEAYVQLGLPEAFPDESVFELADGTIELAASTDCLIAGGDIVASPCLFVALTVVGHAASPERFVTRAGARSGDVVLITGELGGAAAGLGLLEDRARVPSLAAEVEAALRRRQLAPTPLLDAGLLLADCASAMIDVSDGLAADAGHLAKASAVEVEIDLERVPMQAGVAETAAALGVEANELLLGGEDYELLVTVAEPDVGTATQALGAIGVELTLIGAVKPGNGVALLGSGSSQPSPGATGFRQRR